MGYDRLFSAIRFSVAAIEFPSRCIHLMAKKRPSKTDEQSVAPKSSRKSRKKAKKSSKNSNGRPRRVSSGDVTPSRTEDGIQKFVVSESIQAAQEAKVAAVKEIISDVPPYEIGRAHV